MKELKDLTLREFDQYTSLLKEDVVDIFALLNIFGYDANKLSVNEFNKAEQSIQNMQLPTNGVKLIYNVNGRKFKACLDMTKIKAGQFIDFQNYSKDFKLQEILSVFLIPQYKKLFLTRTYDYNKGYDIFEVQNYLYDNFTVGDANELSNFFLNSSISLLKVMKASSIKKELKQRKRVVELKKERISHMFGSKQQKM